MPPGYGVRDYDRNAAWRDYRIGILQGSRRALVALTLASVDVMDALHRAGLDQGLVPRVEAVAAQARALDHPPALVAALEVLARVQADLGRFPDAAATLRELTRVASGARQDHAAAAAWSSLIRLVAYDLGKPDEAIGLADAAAAAVARAGSPLELRVGYLLNVSALHDAKGDEPAGVASLREARKLLEDAGAAADGSPLLPTLGDVVMETGSVLSAGGDHAGAMAAYRESIELRRRAYGPDHPEEAFSWHNLGEQLRKSDRPLEAVEAFQQAIRIREARQGETAGVALTYVGVGAALQEAKKWPDALPYLEKAARISRETMSVDDPKRANALIALGKAYAQQLEWPKARASYDEALALYERTGAVSSNLAITQFNRGNLEYNSGERQAAVEWYDRAIVTFDRVSGGREHRLIFPLEGKGRTLILLGRPLDALPALERALSLELPDVGTIGRREQASARFLHGVALVESKRDRRRGLIEAKQGRDELAAMRSSTTVADDWLAQKH